MNKEKFFDSVRSSLFGGNLSSEEVKGMEGILDAFKAVGDGSPKTLAYALATAYHETGRKMVPVREGFATTDKSARDMVKRYARRYATPIPPYNHVYYGRGHVQLTWAENYKNSSKDAGVDLFQFPDQMLDPLISAKILIVGLIDGRWNAKAKGIGYYLPKNGRDDLQNARRTVNITDKWSEIGGYYTKFLSAVTEAWETSDDVAVEVNTSDENLAKLRDLVEWRAGFPEESWDHFLSVVEYIKRMPK